MNPVNIIPKNLKLHEQFEKDQELQNDAVALTYEKALKHIMNLLSREEFLKYQFVEHTIISDFGENFPLVAAAVNKKTAKIFLILKNEGEVATFIEWDYNTDQESLQVELCGGANGYFSYFPRRISYQSRDTEYLELQTIHYEVSYLENRGNEVDGLRDINLEPLTNSNQIYLHPYTSEIFHKLKDMSSKKNYIEETWNFTYQGKEFFLEKAVHSLDYVLVEPEDLEFIRTTSIKRKNGYSVQSNRLD